MEEGYFEGEDEDEQLGSAGGSWIEEGEECVGDSADEVSLRCAGAGAFGTVVKGRIREGQAGNQCGEQCV